MRAVAKTQGLLQSKGGASLAHPGFADKELSWGLLAMEMQSLLPKNNNKMLPVTDASTNKTHTECQAMVVNMLGTFYHLIIIVCLWITRGGCSHHTHFTGEMYTGEISCLASRSSPADYPAVNHSGHSNVMPLIQQHNPFCWLSYLWGWSSDAVG